MALRQRISQKTRLNIQIRQFAIKSSLTFALVAIGTLAVLNYRNEETFASTGNSENWNQVISTPVTPLVAETPTVDHPPVKINAEGMITYKSNFSTEFYTDRTGDVSIQILSTDGRVLFQCYQYSVTGMNRFEFAEASKLPIGEYFLRISHAGGANIVKLQHKV